MEVDAAGDTIEKFEMVGPFREFEDEFIDDMEEDEDVLTEKNKAKLRSRWDVSANIYKESKTTTNQILKANR